MFIHKKNFTLQKDDGLLFMRWNHGDHHREIFPGIHKSGSVWYIDTSAAQINIIVCNVLDVKFPLLGKCNLLRLTLLVTTLEIVMFRNIRHVYFL